MLALRILSIVFPVFAIIGPGYWYGRVKRPNIGVTNQIGMDVLVPALVFAALASKTFVFFRTTGSWRLAAHWIGVKAGHSVLRLAAAASRPAISAGTGRTPVKK